MHITVTTNLKRSGAGEDQVTLPPLQARQRAEEKLRLTIESVVEGIATTLLDGRIIDANDAKALLHGYSRKDEVIGKNAMELNSRGGSKQGPGRAHENSGNGV